MKRFNDRGAASLAPIVIFSVLFLALTLLIVPQMIDVLYANASNSDDVPDVGYDLIGGHQYQMWTKTSVGGDVYQNVAGSVTEWVDWENQGLDGLSLGAPTSINEDNLNSRVHFSFYDQASVPPENHRLDIWIVRNNTDYESHSRHLGDTGDIGQFTKTNALRDFVFFREYAYSGALWDNRHNFYDVISFNDLLARGSAVDGLTNTTMFSVLGKYNISTFITPSPGVINDLEGALLSNHFSLQVGSDLMNMITRSRIGMWNIVGDLFMFKSTELGMPTWLNVFISTILWICVGFAVLGVISRFIPTIPGLD